MDRRRFLSTGVALALAGCSGDGGTSADGAPSNDDGSSGDGQGASEGTPNGSTSTASDALVTHPAAADLAAQPTLGPDPKTATGVVITFEDPSCSICARFEREVVSELRTEFVERGTVSFVFRGYPVRYPWGEQGTRALEAVDDRDPDSHWSLAEHYFETQSRYSGEDPATVYEKTESFLASETDLDATSTIDAARNGDVDPSVQADLDAGEAAGAGGITPTLFMFRDGEFRSKSAGYTGLSTIKGVLEL